MRKSRFTLDGALWLAQCVVAFTYFWVGAVRLMTPITALEPRIGWVRDLAAQTPLRVVGSLELLLALGVLIPAMTRFQPVITPICAGLLAVLAAVSAMVHGFEGEWVRVGTSSALCLLSVFVAWGRGFAVQIPKRPPGAVSDEDNLIPAPGLQG